MFFTIKKHFPPRGENSNNTKRFHRHFGPFWPFLPISPHFTNYGEIGDTSWKRAISTKNAKFTFRGKVLVLFRHFTISGGKNVGPQQHSSPWARNELFSLNFTKFHTFSFFWWNGGIYGIYVKVRKCAKNAHFPPQGENVAVAQGFYMILEVDFTHLGHFTKMGGNHQI